MLHPGMPSDNHLRRLYLERAVSKKWYNLFVTVDPSAQADSGAGDGPPGERCVEARMVAEMAASVPAVSTFSAAVKDPTSFAEIYQAADIATPSHGYTILKVANMLQSEH